MEVDLKIAAEKELYELLQQKTKQAADDVFYDAGFVSLKAAIESKNVLGNLKKYFEDAVQRAPNDADLDAFVEEIPAIASELFKNIDLTPLASGMEGIVDYAAWISQAVPEVFSVFILQETSVGPYVEVLNSNADCQSAFQTIENHFTMALRELMNPGMMESFLGRSPTD